MTKSGIPIAGLVSDSKVPFDLFGFMENSVEIKGDIINCPEESWDAEES
ncbi:MAG: hypothetical protein WCG04_00340 [Alphaproteobacteria bacterium]